MLYERRLQEFLSGITLADGKAVMILGSAGL